MAFKLSDETSKLTSWQYLLIGIALWVIGYAFLGGDLGRAAITIGWGPVIVGLVKFFKRKDSASAIDQSNENNKNVWILGSILLVIVVVFAYSAGQNSNNQTQSVNNPAEQSMLPMKQTTSSNTSTSDLVNLKNKCAKDGSAYMDNYVRTNNLANPGGYRPIWGNPEYHYDTKINTCLVFISYSQEVSEYSTGSIATNDFSNTIYTGVYAFVFDVYSNQAMLQGVVDRTTQWKGDNIDTLSKYPPYPNIPNLNGSDFNKELAILMSE
jgi:hypothetical protein